jgi:hypothetical protein
VRHMSAIRAQDRWGWRHIGEKAELDDGVWNAPASLTGSPNAGQP